MTKNTHQADKPFQSFKDFWPFYLSEHKQPVTRAIHLGGTITGLALAGAAVVAGVWWLPLLGLGAAYGAAWTAHALIEKNTPATFKYPLWSLRGDFKMLKHFATGTLQQEVDRALGFTSETKPAAERPAAKALAKVRGLSAAFRNTIQKTFEAQPQKPVKNAPKP